MPVASLFGSSPCERHGLPECVLAQSDVSESKTEFHRQVQAQDQNVSTVLVAHAVGTFPSPSFGVLFPKAKTVTAAEAASAFGYVSSPTMAKQINRLMRAQSWSALMSEFGPVIKALVGYIDKMETFYGAKRTLFRGMRLPEQHLQENYAVGKIITWHAFTSVSKHRQVAESYSFEDSFDRGFFLESGVPVLFIISTYFRGAELGGWSPHIQQEEVLLNPFLFFRVTSMSVEPSGNDRLRVIKLQVVKLPRSWAETAPDRLILLHPSSMPWAAQPKEVLSELEEDIDEAVKRKLDPPGAFLLSVFVAVMNLLLLVLHSMGYDLDDFAVGKQGY